VFVRNPGATTILTGVSQTTIYASVGGSIGAALVYVVVCLFVWRSKPLEATSEMYKRFREARLAKIHAEDFGTDEENDQLEAQVDELVYHGHGAEEFKG
jgi:hypothetical protein